jgi:phenylpropionate dioxygenase-like ring-hydroxylating dioxygenase large terminal subunit
MDNASGGPRVFELDDRHKTIEPFDPKKVSHPRYKDWGSVPSRRIDVERYISPEHARLELERMWPFSWHPAGREEEVARPGDYMEYEYGDQSIIVVRTESGELKAYSNVCQHRGTQLIKGCGHTDQFVCPYHGWRWSLEGENRYVHDAVDFPGIKRDELALPECGVDTFGGFIFIRPEKEGPSLQDYLKPVAEMLEPYHLEHYVVKSWRTMVVPANWKTALEAFEEVYHLMGTHPQTVNGNDDVLVPYDAWEGGHGLMVVPVSVPSERFKGRVDEQEVLRVAIENLLDVNLADAGERDAMEELASKPLPAGTTTRSLFMEMAQAQYQKFMPTLSPDRYVEDWDFTIFPNLVFNLFPGNFFGFIARPNGHDPDSCIFDVVALIHPGERGLKSEPRQFITDPAHDWGITLAQDFSNLRRVQNGMHQRGIKATRLAGYQEKRIYNRIDEIDKYYAQHDPAKA